jgi:hypothetical protein
MPAIEGLGSLQKALLSALDQMGATVSSVLQANKDMVFLHQSPGILVDPKEFENPWTPEGGDVWRVTMSVQHAPQSGLSAHTTERGA